LTSTKFTKKLFTWNIGDGLQTGVATHVVEMLKNEYYIVAMNDYIRQICGPLNQLLWYVSSSYHEKHNSKCLSGWI